MRIVRSLLVLAAFSTAATAQAGYDLIIRGGTIIDGTGQARFAGDVAIRGDRIVRVSRLRLRGGPQTRVIDATGKVVAPGFIDLHAHLEPLLNLRGAESHVRQGVTLAVGGPDGGGPLPLAAYLDTVERGGVGMNVAYLIGHNSIRERIMGDAAREPTAAELAQMKELVAQGMRDGAFGISTGLRYIPGYYSKTSEVIELSRVAAAAGGIYTSHLREEGLGLFDGVREAIEIGRQARIPIVLTHHKAVGRQMWGKTVQTLAMVDSARRRGIDVMIDQYPYTASQTGIDVLVPPWALADGDTAFARRVRDPMLRDSIERGILEYLMNDRGGGDLKRVQFGQVAWMRELEGKTLYDWAVMRGVAPEPDKAPPLVIEAVLKGGARMIYHIIDEDDVRRIMRHPQTMIASDGRLTRPGDGKPHPRAYGTFPRVLGRYSRELKLLTLEQAVHKMTGMPARRLGLTTRGVLREGAFADVTVFDPAQVSDRSTFEDPHQYPVGIEHVFVNGVAVVEGGQFTDHRPGRALRRTAPQASRAAPRRR
jgi:N-acyl-D-amino-acid deacylase